MKALVLAAGLGTRLRPYSEHTPKPLFPVGGRPVLARIIEQLITAGCTAVVVNTHHLHHQIEAHVAANTYPIPVTTCHEPQILGTGGAIKNLLDFWYRDPFMVINSDIVTDIDFHDVYRFHCGHDHPVTLVLKDYPRVNTVQMDTNHFVNGFSSKTQANGLTFTGIQVCDPEVLEFIPDQGFYHSIEMYREMLSRGYQIAAYTAGDHYWTDMGTAEDYTSAVFTELAPQAFDHAFSPMPTGDITRHQLSGDGSDRRWYRVAFGERTLIMADHGVHGPESPQEVDAFVDIGNYMATQGVPVPEIHAFDRFAGLVFLEDLGDVHLQDEVIRLGQTDEVYTLYRSIIDGIVSMWQIADRGFRSSWTYQSETYDRRLILDKECRYFLEAFLRDYEGIEVSYDYLQTEFEQLAQGALENAMIGLMHRDMQSRNIMVRKGEFHFIDFQGARIGPLQYDLASLLIDPYVALPRSAQEMLLAHGNEKLKSIGIHRPQDYFAGYRYCAICRNLQMLGAFGYLSRVKKKTYFEQYIPRAVEILKHNLAEFGENAFPRLQSIMNRM
jgi:aminoglycoside/choline kinase family phosphotransferase/dTDP-glucose pyrophosphorylase